MISKMKILSICFLFSFGNVAHASCNDLDSDKEIEILALNIYHEARGESFEGMQMVGEVTLNRVESVKYPNSICEVVYQKKQFSWVKTKKDHTPYEEEKWEEAISLAENLINGEIEYINNGATHFINSKRVRKIPNWTNKFNKVGKIGSHEFYDDGSKRIPLYMPERT